ncbi:MAG TPA: methylmalonyl Co-A mutase-associated GTPase MeaB [Myxococcota bacterium]|nr:methylmalonyl Co-A mutase-associated GTPase MeaB [Myxococcota bacterium]
MAPADAELESLARGVLAGDPTAISSALAHVEDTRPDTLELQRRLLGRLEAATPRERPVVGLTGPPGVGKSTLAGKLIAHWLAAGASVGMVAVDPSSRRSGGALLGDRARLRFRPEQRVFVRSMAARDQLGGLAPATRAAVAVLRAACDWVLVETVGVGQSEVDVETVADTVVLVLQPGSGDTLQFMKAGILEIPDVIAIAKWDLGALAERTRADLDAWLALTQLAPGSWRPPVVGVSGETGFGVDALAGAIDAHRAHLTGGELDARRARARSAWALELFTRRYGTRGLEQIGGRAEAELAVAKSPGSALDAFSALATRAERRG